MTDRELLEKAAKAAGYKPVRMTMGSEWPRGLLLDGVQEPWNPLTDDGDALRLAVGLELRIFHGEGGEGRAVWAGEENKVVAGYSLQGKDKAAATRRAIVLAAAAAIGEQA